MRLLCRNVAVATPILISILAQTPNIVFILRAIESVLTAPDSKVCNTKLVYVSESLSLAPTDRLP